MSAGQVVFVVNLLQDINILRPLTYLASQELNLNTRFLVTSAFRKRDKTGLWQHELSEIAADTLSSIHEFENEFEALQVLQKEHGVLIASSESHLSAHKPVHDLFRVAPSQYIKVTLQHGFECVGFMQSRDQNMAHGSNITFAADIICGWCTPERLSAVAPSQRHKLKVTGSTALLTANLKKPKATSLMPAVGGAIGLVCENMHSPRLNVAGDFKSQFLEIFPKFCAELAKEERQITLRPHPGGQYIIKNDVPIPKNAVLENAPIYKIDLSRFAYGISAPSSILIDMVLAGIPTAVWQDQESVMDLGNYEGLTRISTLSDWLSFAQDAIERPQHYLQKQKVFLERQKLQIDRAIVQKTFKALLLSGTRLSTPNIARPRPRERILFFAPAYLPTLQLSFFKPLVPDMASGNIAVDVVSEVHLNKEFKGESAFGLEARHWLQSRIGAFQPTIAIFCRWAGPHTKWMRNYLAEQSIPTIFHLDDDLLSIPKEVALEKWAYHNNPERLASIRYLLDHASLVYCSTEPLLKQLKMYGAKAPIRAGQIYCSATPIRVSETRPVKKIGYMGIGHEGDLATVLPALVKYLRRNPQVSFELFGTIPMPQALEQFGERVTRAPKIENYEEFLQRLDEYQWDIGICPLAPLPFNLLKANTKWVEYTAVGAAVVASRGTVYDQCCSDGCGILANTEEDWLNALELLTDQPAARSEMVRRAQARLEHNYSPNKLRKQVMTMIDTAHENFKGENKPVNVKLGSGDRLPKRVLFVSNAYVPTLQLSFVKPLALLVARGEIETYFLSEEQVKRKQWQNDGYSSAKAWIISRFEHYQPDLLVFCRYSGPYAKELLHLAEKNNVPTLYHIDDDLLSIPAEIGEAKHRFHNQQNRIDTVNLLLEQTNLVYASTQKLKGHLGTLQISTPIVVGNIYCSGHAYNKPVFRPVRKIGYMASADHAHNMTQVIGALVRLLRKHPNVNFEFFGSIPVPPELLEFGDRIRHALPINNYEQFLQKFSEYQWDIGICPLSPIHFNMMKANTKWVEYTSVGAAVVASRGTVYDECCANGCGLLASTEEEWFAALDSLVSDPHARFRQVMLAQKKLRKEYSVERLRDQVLDVFTQACSLVETPI